MAKRITKPKNPLGLKLLRQLKGHSRTIGQITWASDGKRLISVSADKIINVWDSETGKVIHTATGHTDGVWAVDFSPTEDAFVSGSEDGTARYWNLALGNPINVQIFNDLRDGLANNIRIDNSGEYIIASDNHGRLVRWSVKTGNKTHDVAFKIAKSCFDVSPNGNLWAVAGEGFDLVVFNLDKNEISYLNTQQDWIMSLAFSPDGNTLLAASDSVEIWDIKTGNLIKTLEMHTGNIGRCAFYNNAKIFASKSDDGTVKLWGGDNWDYLTEINVSTYDLASGIEFHPHKPILACVGASADNSLGIADNTIYLWEFDPSALLNNKSDSFIAYTSAKIVLVGDSGVGKTGLGWRLAHGEFKEHSSTHGQQFWLLNQLSKVRSKDSAQCEAILWDLAGQPDYRMIHAIFLDDADLAIVLFDPTKNDNPLSGVEFWINQLKKSLDGGKYKIPILLVAARSDRGTARLTSSELSAFSLRKELNGFLYTSAYTGEGIDELTQELQNLINWNEKPATVTTSTFKRIKEHILSVKEKGGSKVLFTYPELRNLIQKLDHGWEFDNIELETAVKHLNNHGYVVQLRTASGDPRLLLSPELLNNLAASFVLEARRNEKGLGALEEKRLLNGQYDFSELRKLKQSEKDILIDSATALFLKHNVCFRETDPLTNLKYLIFPELINLKKPALEENAPVVDAVSYTVSGAVENVYASLVVLLGYTQTFTRTNQWQNHARYEVGNGLICGFRKEAEREGELDFVLYFGINANSATRMLFQSLFENFLDRKDLNVSRFDPLVCSNTDCGQMIESTLLRKRIKDQKDFVHCSDCGKRLSLPNSVKPIKLSEMEQIKVDEERRFASNRTLFEQKLFRLQSHISENKISSPKCFISYAWGSESHERWVEKNLATDLTNSGITVILDKWENARAGASVPRFVEKVSLSDYVIVVGTPAYRNKYDNNNPMRAFVVAAEGDLIGKRMIGSESAKESVLPLLLDGNDIDSFPPLLHGRVYADFRNNEAYFPTIFNLIFDIYKIHIHDKVRMDLYSSLLKGLV